ncbi:hypothetical protein ACLK1S_10240 [Escherichia coli]
MASQITERVVTLDWRSDRSPGQRLGHGWGRQCVIYLNDPRICPSANQMVIMGGPLNGLYLAMAGCPGRKNYQLSIGSLCQ